MQRMRVFFLGAAAFSLLLIISGGPPSLSGDESLGDALLKENLDLPFNAGGNGEEEESAPEILFFYGQIYEADAVVFCLDASRSMTHGNRWDMQRREVIRAITELNPKTELGVVFYGDGVYSFRDSLVPASPANKTAVQGFINSAELTMGTCLGQGVVKSLKMLQTAQSKHRAVIVAGDGRPTTCPFSPGQPRDDKFFEAILAETLAANPGLSARIHTIYVGSDNDSKATSFMRRLADLHNGTYRVVNQ